MRGRHEKRPSVSREALADKMLQIAADIFKAVIAKLIAEAIMKALGEN